MFVGEAVAEDACVEPPAGCELVRARDLPAALDWIEARGREPAVLIIQQAWPGQTPAIELDRLAQRLPLTRVCTLAGSWCEGEMRTGKPWPAAVRMYGHQFSARAGRELSHLARWQRSAWALPVTAAEDERLAANSPDRDERGGLVAVVAAAVAAGAALADACHSLGTGPASCAIQGGLCCRRSKP